jgi:hypothetical protein
MSDPTRFTETEPQSPEATLLRSMRSDAPGAGSKKALLGALALSAVGGLSGSAAASSASSGWAGAGVAKWLAVVGLCGAVLGAGYSAWNGTSSSAASPSPGLEATNFAAGAGPVAQAPPVPTPASPPVSSLLAELSQPVASAGPPESRGGRAAASALPATALTTARTPERRAGAAVTAHGLSDEVAALERARRALADENGTTALKALSEYDREFKQRTLAPEAEALRIEALLKSGDAVAGRAAAQAFLARHPKSPLAKRVRSLIAQTASSK